MADLNSYISHITDPAQRALATAAAKRAESLDAIGREAFISAGIVDRDPGVRSVAAYLIEVQQETADAAAAAEAAKGPPVVDPAVQAVLDRIDSFFAPKKPNPEEPKEKTP